MKKIKRNLNLNTLAYDCLAKTMNQAIGGPYFTRREQVVRLISQCTGYGEGRASEYKRRGGLSPDALIDFAICNGISYSLMPITELMNV